MRTKQQREATQRCEAGGRAGEHRDGWTDRAGPTSSISWLQEGMAGKMQQKLRGREKKCSELPKS